MISNLVLGFFFFASFGYTKPPEENVMSETRGEDNEIANS